MELVLDEVVLDASARLLSIEWLLLQDPRRRPDPEHPLLPGQKHPGLGCLRIVIGMLVMACERLGFDGVTVVPSHYHVAAQARRLMSFWDPADEAAFIAIGKATQGMNLFQASIAIAEGDVVDVAGRVVSWKPSRMVLPVSAALRERLDGPGYARAVEDAARAMSLRRSAGADG